MRDRPADPNRLKAFRRGYVSEYLAALYLLARGYRIHAIRYRTKLGEIDIVARRAVPARLVGKTGELILEQDPGIIEKAADERRLAIVDRSAGQEAQEALAFMSGERVGDAHGVGRCEQAHQK